MRDIQEIKQEIKTIQNVVNQSIETAQNKYSEKLSKLKLEATLTQLATRSESIKAIDEGIKDAQKCVELSIILAVKYGYETTVSVSNHVYHVSIYFHEEKQNVVGYYAKDLEDGVFTHSDGVKRLIERLENVISDFETGLR